MGQPTHFLPSRQFGMFAIPVPKGFTPEDKLTWTIYANGTYTSIPLRLHPDYVISSFSEIAVGNTPPVIKFEENGAALQGPIGALTNAAVRTASLAEPLALTIWVTDDMKYTSGTNAPMTAKRLPVTLVWSEHFLRITDAIAVERKIEAWSRAKKEALIKSDWSAIQQLSKRRGGQPRPAKTSPSTTEPSDPSS